MFPALKPVYIYVFSCSGAFSTRKRHLWRNLASGFMICSIATGPTILGAKMISMIMQQFHEDTGKPYTR